MDVRDIVTGDKLPYHKVLGKYVVKVEPVCAILESDYFIKQIEACEQARDHEAPVLRAPADPQLTQIPFSSTAPIEPNSDPFRSHPEVRARGGIRTHGLRVGNTAL